MILNLRIYGYFGDDFIAKTNEVISFADLALRIKCDAENKISLGINDGIIRPLHCYKVELDKDGSEIIKYHHFEFFRDKSFCYKYSYPDIFFFKAEVLHLERYLEEFYKEDTAIPPERVVSEKNIIKALNNTIYHINRRYSKYKFIPTRNDFAELITTLVAELGNSIYSFIVSGCYMSLFKQEYKIDREKYTQYSPEIIESNYYFEEIAEANSNLEVLSEEDEKKLSFIKIDDEVSLRNFYANYPPVSDSEMREQIKYLHFAKKFSYMQIGKVYFHDALSEESAKMRVYKIIAASKKSSR